MDRKMTTRALVRALAVGIFLAGLWATIGFIKLYVQAVTGGATGQWQFAVFYTPAPALLSLLAMAMWRATGRLPPYVLAAGLIGVVLPLVVAALILVA
jgi:hypothetical protein